MENQSNNPMQPAPLAKAPRCLAQTRQQLAGLNWKVVAIGDYDGDGRDDLIWEHSSGDIGEWLGTATGDFVNNGPSTSVQTGWAVQSPDIFLI